MDEREVVGSGKMAVDWYEEGVESGKDGFLKGQERGREAIK